MSKTYTDERWCSNCKDNTLHQCYDHNLEVETENDIQTCNVCGYYEYGLSSVSHPPQGKLVKASDTPMPFDGYNPGGSD